MRLAPIALAVLATLSLATAAVAGEAGERRSLRVPVDAPSCDRAAVRACQRTARDEAIRCDAFGDRRACADAALSELSSCWIATGCY